MEATIRRILRRHRSLRGTLCHRQLRSEALQIDKSYLVYEPPGVALEDELPVLYLFRGHEREWANLREDHSRRSTAVEDLDWLIAHGILPPLLAVMPGLSSTDNHVPALGIDMAGTWPENRKGLGTGRFWAFLTDELMPSIDRRYPQAAGGLRLAAGFSLGGYTTSLLAIQCPKAFDHAALYDGTLMWPSHRDPREPEKIEAEADLPSLSASEPAAAPPHCTDPVWCRARIFDPALGRPRSTAALARWNPTDALQQASAKTLARLRTTTFWVRCAAGDGTVGNQDRARFFVDLLRARNIPLGFAGEDIAFHPHAAHTWHWADRFLIRFLCGVFDVDADV